jgi:hypothetical protein
MIIIITTQHEIRVWNFHGAQGSECQVLAETGYVRLRIVVTNHDPTKLDS